MTEPCRPAQDHAWTTDVVTVAVDAVTVIVFVALADAVADHQP